MRRLMSALAHIAMFKTVISVHAERSDIGMIIVKVSCGIFLA
jgi:hypothetical protein